MSNLVTGEAVVLDLQLAKLPSRALGFVIDATVQILLLAGVLVLVTALAGTADDALVAATAIAGTLLIFVALPAAVETLTRGRSLGKLALGLRVVRDDGGMIRFRHALVRALAGFVVDFWLLGWTGIGVLTSLASSRGKRVGDYLAGTVVIRERIPARGGPVAQMPPDLAEWASGLQLSALPDDLAMAARQFVSRAGELAPEVRDGMGRRLAADVARHLGGTIPAGVPPATYLSAVLAERRNRELARLTRQGLEGPTVGAQKPDADQREGGASGDDPFAPPR